MKWLLTFFLSASAIFSQAQPGTIDKTYGTDKTGTASFSSQFSILSSAIQPDDKLVLGGTYNDTIRGAFTAVRNNKDGSLDTSFGINGYARINVSDLIVNNLRSANGWAGIAVRSDGKIVATGTVGYINANNNDFDGADIVVAQYLPNGLPDESFGSHGRVVTAIAYSEISDAIAIQSDGKIVVAGTQDTDRSGNSRRILVVRYNTDGTLDNSFGNGNGYVAYVNRSNETTWATAVLVQPDGKIVAGGYITHGTSTTTTSFFLLRYLPDGTQDASFGDNGEVTTRIGTVSWISSLALDSKERILAAGITTYSRGGTVIRYLPDGSIDNSFGQNGRAALQHDDSKYPSFNIGTVLAQPADKLVVSSTDSYTDDNGQFAESEMLSAFNEDGSPDSSFGTEYGRTVTNTGLIDYPVATAVMQSDGKIVVSANNTYYYPFLNTCLLTRFNGYPVHVSLAVRIKRFLQNHGITWKGLPADNKIAYYSVEQSSNGNKGFASLAKVSGRSNLNDYSFTNNHLLTGANYYRVKAVSIDGTVRYSEVVSADNTAASASVYPNPARSYVTVQGLPVDATANITLKDGSGTVLQRGVSGGSAQYRSSLANLLPGTYYLNITTTNGKTEVLPFVKE